MERCALPVVELDAYGERLRGSVGYTPGSPLAPASGAVCLWTNAVMPHRLTATLAAQAGAIPG